MTARRDLADLIRPRLKAAESGLAMIDLGAPGGRAWTAESFDAGVDALARRIAARGLAPQSRIGILAGNGAATLQTYFAIMRAGHVAAPLNHAFSSETLSYIATDAELALIFIDELRRPAAPQGIASALICEGEPGGGPFQPPEPAPDALAKILYTSGSTGRPKGVMLEHAGQVWAIERSLERTPARSVIVAAPLYHKNGLFHATVALAQASTLISLPKFEAGAYLRAAAEHRAEKLTGVPTMFALMARETALLRTLDLSCVRQVSVGSAPLSAALAAQIQAMFPGAGLSNGYGTTEVGPLVFGQHPESLPTPVLSLGVPDPAIEWRLVGGASEGVLQLRTRAMMRGYVNAPQATAERLRDGWYDTGDVMRRDEDGFFYFVGRVDDMFVTGGENVYPIEVERLVERHPDVAQAAVVPGSDPIKGEVPIAFVVAREGVAIDPADVRRFTLEHGPAYAHPRAVIVLDALPLAGTHKIDRSGLRRRADEAAIAARARKELIA